MRILLTIEYDGTQYCGWQIQPNGVTVQQKIEEAVLKLTGERARVTGSGRTDAGVHALGQAAHFDTAFNIPPEKFAPALNALLPDDIKILSSRQWQGHARFSAKKKTYLYRFYESETARPLFERYAARVRPLDVCAMDSAAKLFEGEHDFAAFMASGSCVKDTVRTVYSASVARSGGFVEFTVAGNGFLYNMVRIMAGAIVEVGYGKSPAFICRALDGGSRFQLGKTMPAKGLTLVSVEYEE